MNFKNQNDILINNFNELIETCDRLRNKKKDRKAFIIDIKIVIRYQETLLARERTNKFISEIFNVNANSNENKKSTKFSDSSIFTNNKTSTIDN